MPHGSEPIWRRVASASSSSGTAPARRRCQIECVAKLAERYGGQRCRPGLLADSGTAPHRPPLLARRHQRSAQATPTRQVGAAEGQRVTELMRERQSFLGMGNGGRRVAEEARHV